jgi:hypothetical protein
MENAIAGFTHKVEIKDNSGKTLFTKDVDIEEKGTYDLSYNFQEFVEVVNETNTNRMLKKDYRPPVPYSGASSYFRQGPVLHAGGGSFLWAGWNIDYENISIEGSLTFIPRIPNYMYDWYIGGEALFAFHIFRPDNLLFNLFNCYLKTGVMAYYGIELGFPKSSPYLYMGFGISLKPRWGFMRDGELFLEMGTEQDFGVLWKNFSVNETGLINNDFNRNTGWPMLTFGVKF